MREQPLRIRTQDSCLIHLDANERLRFVKSGYWGFEKSGLVEERERERKKRKGNGESRRNLESSKRGDRRTSRLGEPRVHLQHLSQCSPPLRIPSPVRYASANLHSFLPFTMFVSIDLVLTCEFSDQPSLHWIEIRIDLWFFIGLQWSELEILIGYLQSHFQFDVKDVARSLGFKQSDLMLPNAEGSNPDNCNLK